MTLDNNSYIDEDLKEHFSDIVYTCFCKDKELKITLLFEHKSYPAACPYLQLLKYLLKIWETNVKQTERLMPVIPVILYHGKVDKVVNTIKEISERGGELGMTTAVKLIEKGKAEGKAEGRIEGKIEGLKEAIEIGLELKYGVEGLKLLEKIINMTLIVTLIRVNPWLKYVFLCVLCVPHFHEGRLLRRTQTGVFAVRNYIEFVFVLMLMSEE